MRSGSSVKGNTAEFSGGGIELDNPILFASFVDLYIEDNVVENGEGGGMMLRATCEVFHSSIAGNAASSGAGIEIDHVFFFPPLFFSISFLSFLSLCLTLSHRLVLLPWLITLSPETLPTKFVFLSP